MIFSKILLEFTHGAGDEQLDRPNSQTSMELGHTGVT